MLSLFNLSMASIVKSLMGNMENAAYKCQVMLDDHLPTWNRFRLGLVSAVLNELYSSLISGEDGSPAQQREMIPLLKLCIKTSHVLCGDKGWMHEILPDYCNDNMRKIMMKLDAGIKCELKIATFLQKC